MLNSEKDEVLVYIEQIYKVTPVVSIINTDLNEENKNKLKAVINEHFPVQEGNKNKPIKWKLHFENNEKVTRQDIIKVVLPEIHMKSYVTDVLLPEIVLSIKVVNSHLFVGITRNSLEVKEFDLVKWKTEKEADKEKSPSKEKKSCVISSLLMTEQEDDFFSF